MKTVKNIVTGEVKRLSEEKAIVMTRGNEWLFCPKSDWKKIEKGQMVSYEISSEKFLERLDANMAPDDLKTIMFTGKPSNPKVKKSGKNKGEVK